METPTKDEAEEGWLVVPQWWPAHSFCPEEGHWDPRSISSLLASSSAIRMLVTSPERFLGQSTTLWLFSHLVSNYTQEVNTELPHKASNSRPSHLALMLWIFASSSAFDFYHVARSLGTRGHWRSVTQHTRDAATAPRPLPKPPLKVPVGSAITSKQVYTHNSGQLLITWQPFLLITHEYSSFLYKGSFASPSTCLTKCPWLPGRPESLLWCRRWPLPSSRAAPPKRALRFPAPGTGPTYLSLRCWSRLS